MLKRQLQFFHFDASGALAVLQNLACPAALLCLFSSSYGLALGILVLCITFIFDVNLRLEIVTYIRSLTNVWLASEAVLNAVFFKADLKMIEKEWLFCCRILVKKGRKLAMEYELMYGEEIPTTQLVTKLAAVMQEYTQSGYVLSLWFPLR